MTEQMTHAEIVRKLIGPIEPLGCSARDPERLKNLKELGELLYELASEVADLACNSNRQEHSIKKIGDQANSICDNITEAVRRV